MARAKRFDRDRAEARRRHRAALAATAAEEEAGTAEAIPSDSPEGNGMSSGASGANVSGRALRLPLARSAGRPSPGGSAAPQPGARLGVIQAARAAYRRVSFRDDFRALPGLLVHRAVWIPVLISLATALMTIAIGPGNTIASFAFSVFVLPPAMATIFITGFFAPTAAWLLGGIVGFATAVFYAGFMLAAASGIVPGADVAQFGQQVSDSILSGFVIAIAYGVVLGAAAAWYKRFLYLSSPARSGGGRSSGGASRKGRAGASRQGSRGR